MDLAGWDERYRASEDKDGPATPLLIETARNLAPGTALDLACGAGRNALWLARHGWSVTAVDGSSAAVDILARRAADQGLAIATQVADLERNQYAIQPAAWNLIALCYYLQRDLFTPAKAGVVPGGIVLAIVHITEPGEEPTRTRLRPGELATHFTGWQILHSFEGKPSDPAHQRSVAEIVARRPY